MDTNPSSCCKSPNYNDESLYFSAFHLLTGTKDLHHRFPTLKVWKTEEISLERTLKRYRILYRSPVLFQKLSFRFHERNSWKLQARRCTTQTIRTANKGDRRVGRMARRAWKEKNSNTSVDLRHGLNARLYERQGICIAPLLSRTINANLILDVTGLRTRVVTVRLIFILRGCSRDPAWNNWALSFLSSQNSKKGSRGVLQRHDASWFSHFESEIRAIRPVALPTYLTATRVQPGRVRQ